MNLFVVTAINNLRKDETRGDCRCSNVWLTEEDSINSVKSNYFDVWEGFTNKYCVIEKMKIGEPWTCKTVQWFSHEKINQEDHTVKYLVYEIDTPEEWDGICNLGIG